MIKNSIISLKIPISIGKAGDNITIVTDNDSVNIGDYIYIPLQFVKQIFFHKIHQTYIVMSKSDSIDKEQFTYIAEPLSTHQEIVEEVPISQKLLVTHISLK